MNRCGNARYSLSTAMRAFLLDHEITQGAARLYFEGGTPNPMRFAFVDSQATDILALRRLSLRCWLLRRFAHRMLPEKNFLRAALTDPDMLCA